MSSWFATPGALWALLLAGPLLLFYMLRHRPVRRRVPSVLLWAGAAQFQVSTSPFQRLQKSLSLLLMLLGLLALTLALAGLRVPGGRKRTLPVVLVVDCTASMAATELDGSRLELARARAGAALDASGDCLVTLLAWDGALRPASPPLSERSIARAALDNLVPAEFGADDAALGRALEQLHRADSDRRLVLVSEHMPGTLPPGTVFVSCGSPLPNAGITAASLTESAPGQSELFFGLEFFGPQAGIVVQTVLERVDVSEPELVDARDVELRAGVRRPLVFPAPGPGLYRLRIKNGDALEKDNAAYVRFAALPVQDVAVVGEAGKPMNRALEAIQQTMGILRVVPSASAEPRQTMFVIADPALAGTLPRLPAVFIAPSYPAGVTLGTEARADEAAARPARSFLWRGAGVPDIRIPKLKPLQGDRFMAPVLDAGPGTAVALVRRDDGTGLSDLALGFAPDDDVAGFAGKFAFVIFWANWFEHGRRLREPLPRGAATTREAVEVRRLLEMPGFEYRREGDDDWLQGNPGEALQLDRAGVYRFQGLAECELPVLGVSLLDAAESNTMQAGDLEYSEEDVASALESVRGEGESDNLDLRPWLALLAAALLLFEWFWFRRAFPVTTGQAPARGRDATAVRSRPSRV